MRIFICKPHSVLFAAAVVFLGPISSYAISTGEAIHNKWIEEQALFFETESFKKSRTEIDNKLKKPDGTDAQPFSSSYLPKLKGDLYRTDKIVNTPKLLNKVFLKQSNQKSVLDRYLGLSERILKLKSNKDIFLELFDKKEEQMCQDPITKKESKCKVESWEGYCDQWAAASVDKALMELDDKVAGVVCDGVVLSKGEVRELFTAFATELAKDTFFAGVRVYEETKPTQYRKAFLNLKGLSDISPASVMDKINEQLKNNAPILMDRDPGPEVWNQPIYQAKTETTPLKPGYDIAVFLDKIPASLMKTTSSQIQTQIDELKKIDLELLADSNQAQFNNNIFAGAQQAIFEYGMFGMGGYFNKLQKRADILRSLKQSAMVGLLTLDSDVTVEVNRSLIRFGLESKYAEGKNYNGTDLFIYGTIKKEDKVIDSFWISPEQKTANLAGGRPDFIWVPYTTNEAKIDTHPLGHLMKILKHYRCTPLAGLLALEGQILGNKGKPISPEKKKAVLDIYKQLKPGRVIDAEEMRKLLTEAAIPNLKASDFGI